MRVQSIIDLFSSSASNNKNNNDKNHNHGGRNSSSPYSNSKSNTKKPTKQPLTASNKQDDDQVLVIKLREEGSDDNNRLAQPTQLPPSSAVQLQSQPFDHDHPRQLVPKRPPPLPRYRLKSILTSLSTSKTTTTRRPTHSDRSTQIKIALPSRNRFPHQSHLDSNNPSDSSCPSVSSSLSRNLSRNLYKSLHLNPPSPTNTNTTTTTTTTTHKSKPVNKKQGPIFRNSLSSPTIPLSTHHKQSFARKSSDQIYDRRTPGSLIARARSKVKKNSTSHLNYKDALKKTKHEIQEAGNKNNQHKKTSLTILRSDGIESRVNLHHQPTKMNNPNNSLDDPSRSRSDRRSSSDHIHQPEPHHPLGPTEVHRNSELYFDSISGEDSEDGDDATQAHLSELKKDQFDFNHQRPESPSSQPLITNPSQTSRKTNSRYALCDFELIRTLGTGSFGRVHLSKSRHNGRGYAIKVLNKKRVVSLKQVEHTNSERQMLAAVRHPFLVNLWGTFADSYNLYMVMDFVSGGELFNLLRKSQRFPDPVAKFFGAEVALALDYLHCLDIVYRDLKPENILLGSDGHIKITDFGFAKLVPDITWTLCGTPDYLAPEIVQSKGYNKSVDWYALGVLIFEMLAGYPPFYCEDESPMRLYEKIIAGKVRYPSYFNPSAKDLLKSLLTSDLSKRFGNLANGSRDIFHHAWFAEVDWERLYRKQIPAPYVPRVSSEWDSSNFDHYDEASLEEYGKVGEDPYGHLFPGF